MGLALDVASMGPGESVQEHYLGSQHHAAMQRLEGRGRHEGTHVRPVAVGGGLRPPQDRAAPPVSTGNRVAHMGLPLLRR